MLGVSPDFGLDSYREANDTKLYPYISPMQPCNSSYIGNAEWALKGNSLHLNPLEKVNPVISNFERSNPSSNYLGVPLNQVADYVMSIKSSEIKTANFDDKDDEFIKNFENSEDTSSIHSATALEVSCEFIKNDYLSLKTDQDWGLSQPPKLMHFFDGSGQIHRHESPRIQLINSMPFNNQLPVPSFTGPIRKREIPLRVIKQPKTPADKPSFSGNEFVPSFKRQKFTDSPQEPAESLDIKKVSHLTVLCIWFQQERISKISFQRIISKSLL